MAEFQVEWPLVHGGADRGLPGSRGLTCRLAPICPGSLWFFDALHSVDILLNPSFCRALQAQTHRDKHLSTYCPISPCYPTLQIDSLRQQANNHIHCSLVRIFSAPPSTFINIISNLHQHHLQPPSTFINIIFLESRQHPTHQEKGTAHAIINFIAFSIIFNIDI